MGQLKCSDTAGGDGQPLWRTLHQFPTIPLLGVYSRQMTVCVIMKSYTTMLTAALFVTPAGWKQSKCPSSGKWIDKLWCTHTMKYFTEARRNELHTLNNVDEPEINMLKEAR